MSPQLCRIAPLFPFREQLGIALAWGGLTSYNNTRSSVTSKPAGGSPMFVRWIEAQCRRVRRRDAASAEPATLAVVVLPPASAFEVFE